MPAPKFIPLKLPRLSERHQRALAGWAMVVIFCGMVAAWSLLALSH